MAALEYTSKGFSLKSANFDLIFERMSNVNTWCKRHHSDYHWMFFSEDKMYYLIVYSKAALDARLIELGEMGKIHPPETIIRLSQVTRKRDVKCLEYILGYTDMPFDGFGLGKM